MVMEQISQQLFLDFEVVVTFSATSSKLFSESPKEISTFLAGSETGSIEAFNRVNCLLLAVSKFDFPVFFFTQNRLSLYNTL